MSVPTPTDLLTRLVQFDTSNFGAGRSNGERACAEWIQGLLEQAGYQTQMLHRADSPDRTNLVVQVEGRNPELPGVLLQAHLDVVPVEPEQWTVPPFEGLVRDGYVYGRGVADMKDTVAKALHTLLCWAEEGVRPNRNVTIAFVADEEDAGQWGAEWLAAEHPELFEGIGLAIGEDGALCDVISDVHGNQRRLYTINAGERGSFHIRLTARGVSGHGSRPSGDDAVTRLVRAVDRIVEHQWPLMLSPVVRAHLEGLADAFGIEVDTEDEASIANVAAVAGDAGGPIGFTVRVSATPTVLQAGYKTNVIPGLAVAEIDVRCPPGAQQAMEVTLAELIGTDVEWEWLTYQPPIQSPVSGPWFDAMRELVLRHDPEAVVVPGCMGGGTDNKAFEKLGITTYGFTPSPADPDGRRYANYHGVDEQMPVSVLEGGALWLRDFLETV